MDSKAKERLQRKSKQLEDMLQKQKKKVIKKMAGME